MLRHRLEDHALTPQIVETVCVLLDARQLPIGAGTIVNTTNIAEPIATTNATKRCAKEMTQTRKGQQWYVGMKVHVGTDTRGLVHSRRTTEAVTSDITQLDDLLQRHKTTLSGDNAHWREAD